MVTDSLVLLAEEAELTETEKLVFPEPALADAEKPGLEV